MPSTLLSFVATQAGRLLPVVLALQDAPRPTGGSPAAPAQGGGGGPGGPAGLAQFALPLLAFVFMYFVLIRPAGKQRKEQEALQKGLQSGDRVVTTSGMIGKVTAIEDQYITLEIAEKTRVKFLREAVVRKVDAAQPATSESK